ncbi:MAG TPA: asparagine synthase B [Xanthobacteraceae bacterium]|jgi:asparagine synthase (glutamine-hydrolysing)
MCGILGILDVKSDPVGLRRLALKLSRLQRHRGPDWSGVFSDDGAVLVHERLAIVGVESGAQPIRSADGDLALAVNGEIYNHRELEDSLREPYAFQTKSDCEIINALYRQEGPEGFKKLNGIFAFILWDRAARRYLIARDPIGVCPLYIGNDEHGNLFVASELKALVGVCRNAEIFPPGHYLDSRVGKPVRYYNPAWRSYESTKSVGIEPAELHATLEAAVRRQLMSDVPYGVLLSGGLDSSVIAACAAKFAARRIENDGATEAWWPRLHSFAIGLDSSPDLAAARIVATALGTVHHEFRYTVQDGLDALSDVIYHIESFDVTTVRASTPMYLMARCIKTTGVKMVLSGEGSDEIFGGYLYFHKAPSACAFHDETVRKVFDLYRYDCLRANKSMAAWGVEARVPFLDLEFLEVAMRFDAAHKMVRDGGMEKQVLRRAFEAVLPEAIVWRQKEQFSDGVGYGWIDALKTNADLEVSDDELRRAHYRFPLNPPRTKEEYLYRRIFESHFPGDAAAATVPVGPSIACSSPAAMAWDPNFAKNADPSGRAVAGVHRASLKEKMPMQISCGSVGAQS